MLAPYAVEQQMCQAIPVACTVLLHVNLTAILPGTPNLAAHNHNSVPCMPVETHTLYFSFRSTEYPKQGKTSATSTMSDNGKGLEKGSINTNNIMFIIVLPEVFSLAAQHVMHALQRSHRHSLPAPQ